MATYSAKTLQEKFGFMDPDIKKPEHDEIISWIDDNVEDLLMLLFNSPTRPLGIRTRWEALVHKAEEGNGMPIGFADLVALTDSGFYFGREWQASTMFVFEAKTTIGSLGELFRQIRLYKDGYIYGSPVWKMRIIVVCPDDKHAQKIREQGFYFLKYDPTTKFAIGGV